MNRSALAPEEGLEVYLRQINETRLLSADEERELANQLRGTDQAAAYEARDRMVRANLRLVVNIAKNYAGRGVPISDLIEEGNLGLMRAVEGYDPEQGSRFSTYASWWIKQGIKRALIGAGQPMHIPAYMAEELSRWRKKSADLERQLGRPANPEEIARALKLPAKRAKVVEEAAAALSTQTTGLSSDADFDLADVLVDDRQDAPDQRLFAETDRQIIRELLSQLDEREARILALRYGLEGGEPMILKDVGAILGLTRERVRQLEAQAFETLREYIQKELG